MKRRHLAAVAGLALPWWVGGCEPRRDLEAAAWESGWVGGDATSGHRLRDARSDDRAPAKIERVGVAIVGGGVAGLAAARALMLAGVDDLVLLELEAEAGGNARGHAIDGIACPLGAHYLPVPGEGNADLRAWLEAIGLMTHRHGRWRAEERNLCHSPQERLWFEGAWHEGLMPPLVDAPVRRAQAQRLARAIGAQARAAGFALPSVDAPWLAGHAALDAQPFVAWLAAQGVDDAGLLGYLDYACRDDFGAGLATVSAWAGIHYFASRHGFRAPGGEAIDDGGGDDHDDPESEGVFTWPEGNAWLTRKLAAPLGDRRLRTRHLVTRVEGARHDASVDAIDLASGRPLRWQARFVVLALPLHVASRVVRAPTSLASALSEAAQGVAHAPWLVANLHLDRALDHRHGATPPSWDNVLFAPAGTSDALGYVDASHQSLKPVRAATVLSAYWALGRDGGEGMRAQRRALLDDDARAWSRRVVADLARAHPDLPAKTTRVDLMRYGHAMAIPRPGTKSLLQRLALHHAARAGGERIVLAHGDLAGYSVFEEAFALGHRAGVFAAQQLR